MLGIIPRMKFRHASDRAGYIAGCYIEIAHTEILTKPCNTAGVSESSGNNISILNKRGNYRHTVH